MDRSFSKTDYPDSEGISLLMPHLAPEITQDHRWIEAKIRSMVGDLPVDTFGLRLAAPGMPAQDVADHLELFAGKVLPHFSGS
jgi:hypothetical protein